LEKGSLCFVSSRSAHVRPEAVSADYSNGLLVQYLTKQISDMALAVYADPQESVAYTLDLHVVRTYKLPFPFSQVAGIKNTLKIYRILSEARKHNKLLIIQLPNIGVWALPFIKGNIVYHMCANVLTAARNPQKYSGLLRVFSKAYSSLVHRLHKHLFKNSDASVIVHGSELGKVYSQYNPVVAISSSFFREEVVNEGALNYHKTLLFVGRPSKEKGFDTLLEAFGLLNNREFSLSFVGFTKDEFFELYPKLRNKENSQRHKFYGFIDWRNGLKQILQQSFALVLPSLSEGTPRVLLEAMSQGCPVIAAETGGIPDIVEDGKDGILFKPGDTQDLLQKLQYLIGDENKRTTLIRNGIEKAKKNTIEDFGNTFLEILKKYE